MLSVCGRKYNVQNASLFVTKLWFYYLQVIYSLELCPPLATGPKGGSIGFFEDQRLPSLSTNYVAIQTNRLLEKNVPVSDLGRTVPSAEVYGCKLNR